MDERENIPAALAHDNRSVTVKDLDVNYNRDIKMLEYARLRSLVPSVASRSRVSKIQVIEEAIKYIALLQQALRTQPDTQVEEVTEENTEAQTRSKTLRAKRQRIASYMIQPQRHSPKTRPKFAKSTTKKRTKFLRI